MRSRGLVVWVVILSLLMGAVGGWLFSRFGERMPKALFQTAADSAATPPAARKRLAFESDFINAAAVASPSVVHVRTRSYVEEVNPYRGSIIEFFFGPQPNVRRPVEATGSGVVVARDGYIVTNNHVVANARAIEVTLTDGQSYRAQLVGTDPLTDLAMLKVTPKAPIPAIELGHSDSLQVGSWVLAVGNPFNLQNTVTAGIVSATARTLNHQTNRPSLEAFIQIDAAVNPGNSGGALVDLQGQLVGINTAIASPTGSFTGYAFSIPETLVRKFINDMLVYGKVRRTQLGVQVTEANSNGRGEARGVQVVRVLSNSNAEAAGVQEGDVIVSVNGKSIDTPSQLTERVGIAAPGDTVVLALRRGGNLLQLQVPMVK
ncbi:MAG: hypothetical protein AL399_02345 [Candidatus [Bacteroides] periocalifornicus]|uniref:PDZ domain-containing protein n=1 Tax=Candidatus [Bacteroides] periocalifornicus TaxID=1702214 RepID=A0A0Q4B932_9BACT|nr:MAG: hypothetical protein AL399_02320 [Candidatus [Bacteroides] periocalifornicus]KQM09356.1 MAG: hypothetical protein AL399_02345 [Candidatus [Bacteroides] periocalifornicus]